MAGKPEPTVGIEDHTEVSIEFWKTFPDQQLDNRWYKVFFAMGDWTCSIARLRATMKGPTKADGGQIVEENLMYDLVTFLKRIGLGE